MIHKYNSLLPRAALWNYYNDITKFEIMRVHNILIMLNCYHICSDSTFAEGQPCGLELNSIVLMNRNTL